MIKIHHRPEVFVILVATGCLILFFYLLESAILSNHFQQLLAGLLFIALMMGVESLLNKKKRPSSYLELFINFYYLFSGTVLGTLSVIFLLGFIFKMLPSFSPLAELPLFFKILLGLIMAEFGHYWVHRFLHQTKRTRIHSIHHKPKSLNILNSTRFHFLEVFCRTLIIATPLLLLGLNFKEIVYIGTIRDAVSVVSHINIVPGPIRVLDFFIMTPYMHYKHHEVGGNYGACLTIWDHIFGTYKN